LRTGPAGPGWYGQSPWHSPRFFLTPIIYPVTSVPERFRALIAFNPATPFFVAYQEALLYNRLVSWETFGVMIGLGAVTLLVGMLIFGRLRWSLVEEV
jgi:lipopolysaccharide transport system permease protein